MKVYRGIHNYFRTRCNRLMSEKDQTVVKSKRTLHWSCIQLASQNQVNDDGISGNKYFSDHTIQNVQWSPNNVMKGEKLSISHKKPRDINGRFIKASGIDVVNNNLGLMSEAATFDHQCSKPMSIRSQLNQFDSYTQGHRSEIPAERRCSHVGSEVSEQLEKIQTLQKSRLLITMREEAIDRARLMVVEAEKAAKALEDLAKSNAFVNSSLREARRLLAEAAQSIEALESRRPSLPVPAQYEKISWYASDGLYASGMSLSATKISKDSWTPRHEVTHRSSRKSANDSGILSGGNNDLFDLVDSWIISGDPEKLKASHSSNIREFHKGRKVSWFQPRVGATKYAEALTLSNLSKESLTFTPPSQNSNYSSFLAAMVSLGKRFCEDGNWTLYRQPKALKKWHYGRLINVENDESS